MRWHDVLLYVLCVMVAAVVLAVYAVIVAIACARMGLLPIAALPAAGSMSGG